MMFFSFHPHNIRISKNEYSDFLFEKDSECDQLKGGRAFSLSKYFYISMFLSNKVSGAILIKYFAMLIFYFATLIKYFVILIFYFAMLIEYFVLIPF